MININEIQEVKARADIVKVAYRMNINLNSRLKAKCPFHDEKTASFSINKHKQIFKCFGCGVGGDCITLVSKLLGVNAYEAAKCVNDLLGLGVDFGQKSNQFELEKYKHQQLIKEEYKKWKNKAFNTICNYFHYLKDKNDYEQIDMVEYFIDIFIYGTEEEQKQFYIQERKWVNELERRGFG